MKKFVAGAVVLAMAFSFVLVPTTHAQTVDSLTAQINSLLSTIASLQAQLAAMHGGSSTTSSGAGYQFAKDLTIGSKGADVTALQQILVSKGYLTMPSGVAMGYFGKLTQTAVIAWQKAAGISPAAGYVGPKSRAALNAMGGTTTTTTTGGTTTTTTVTPTGGSLSVAPAASQPAAQLAPQNASRVPFTKIVLTAGSSDVVVNGITITRTGPAQDAVFAGIVLLDENGLQMDTAKTLNSNHQTTIGGTFTVKAGQTRTLTVAGNMLTTSLVNYAGQVAVLTVSGVNTSAPVVGSLPISGTAQTINSSLTIGTAQGYISSYDPSSGVTQNIGTTGYRFAGVRVNAGSAEDITLYSIRWNQTGSAAAGDLANVVTVINGVQYPTTVSTDGKYYTASFGNGIVVAKGFSVDAYIQGDIVGSSSAGRTVEFDIYKATDVYITGNTYGYGITMTANSTGTFTTNTVFTTGTPFFHGSIITINAGSLTTITNATAVAAQNIAVNVPNQPFGGFTTNIKGEPISVQGMVFRITLSDGSGATNLPTSVSLVDQNGAVVAGPVDAAAGVGQAKVTFTDTVTIPVGPFTYTLKGKVPSTVTNGVTLTASTSPATDWSNVTGQTTGNTISLSAVSAVTTNQMTVKTSALAVAVSTNPAAQNLLAGAVGFLFTNFQFDASQSGEDVRFSSIPLTLTKSGGNYNDVSGCQLYNGSTPLNTGSNVINPTVAHGGAETFVLDSALTIPKGTVVTLSLKCNVVSSAASGAQYHWDITAANVTAMSVTGVTSSNTVTNVGGSGTGATMTVNTASLTVGTDASSPSYAVVQDGATGVTLGVMKLRASNDSLNLQRVVLKLTNTASSSPADLVQVTLWNGATQVGTAVFTGGNTYATSTLLTPLSLARDTDTQLTIKGDLSAIGVSAPVNVSGHLVAVDYSTNDVGGTYATSQSSGVTVNASGSTAFSGVRVFGSYPTLAAGTLTSNGVSDGHLLRFTVTSTNGGSVGIAKFSVTIATSSVNVTNVNAFAYTDSAYSQPVSGVNTGGQLMTQNYAGVPSTALTFYPQTTSGATTTIQIPAGQTRYFEVRGTVSGGATTGYSVTVTLNGDSAYPAQAGGLVSTSTTEAWIDGGNGQYASNRSFIWSPNSTSTATVNDVDWTNGYALPGLPASGFSVSRTQ